MPSSYDDTNLRRLFAEMEPRRRLQALRGGFRKEANRVRKTAINNLRSSGIRSSKDLEKGIRTVVYRRAAGFRVTVGTKRANRNGRGEAGFHTNRFGQKKPILIWAESGTAERRTKPKQGTRRRGNRMRESHRTGRMKRYGYMEQTLNGVRSTVTQDLRQMIADNVLRVAQRYGCR